MLSSLNPALFCRYFETEPWNGLPGQWWFGGGTDITPSYLDVDDMKHFHGTYKKVGREGIQRPEIGGCIDEGTSTHII